MNYEQPSIERRQHMRVHAPAAVIVRARGRELLGRVVVVSETSLEVRCQLAVTVQAVDGASVAIEMRLDGCAGTWFVAHGKVVRAHAATHSLVIALDALPAPLAKLVADETARDCSAPIEVIVVDSNTDRRMRVADAFRAQGCNVAEVNTALEALDVLTQASCPIRVIAVADTAPERGGIELRNYLDTAYADALVVGIGDPEWIPTRVRLDPSVPDDLLRCHVQALLRPRPVRHSVPRA